MPAEAGTAATAVQYNPLVSTTPSASVGVYRGANRPAGDFVLTVSVVPLKASEGRHSPRSPDAGRRLPCSVGDVRATPHSKGSGAPQLLVQRRRLLRRPDGVLLGLDADRAAESAEVTDRSRAGHRHGRLHRARLQLERRHCSLGNLTPNGFEEVHSTTTQRATVSWEVVH